MRNGPYTFVIAPKDYPGKKYRDRYAYEHTVVWWKKTGVVPAKGFEIHHKNGNHRDNRLSNLELMTSQAHHKIHADLKRKPPIQFNCGFCKKLTELSGNDYRFRLKRSKSGKLFCSARCGAMNQHGYTSVSLAIK